MRTRELDITIVVHDGYELIKRQPVRIMAWGLIAFVLPLILAFLGGVLAAAAAGADPSQQMTRLVFGQLGSVLQFVLMVPIYAAVTRQILGKETTGSFMGLKLGADEFWVFVSYLAMSLILMTVVVAIAVVFGITGYVGYAATQSGWIWVMVILLSIGLFIAFYWVTLRLMLSVPASVELRKLAFAEAWAATKGNTLRLLGAFLLVALIGVACYFILATYGAICFGIGFGLAWMLGVDFSSVLAEPWKLIVAFGVAGLLFLPALAFYGGAILTFAASLIASAWKQLRPRLPVQPDVADFGANRVS